MDQLEAMSIVLAVAEAGSLSAAARRLNTPPATASRKITELEEHLRAKLFDRSARKLMLTDSGLSYVAALKRILADLSEADRAAAGEYTKPTGELIVTAPVLGRLHLIPILAEFLRAYPDIDIRLVLVDRILSLPEDHVDVALRVGTLPDSRLVAQRLGTVRRVVCASPAYLEARGTPKTPDDLAAHDCIIYDGFLGQMSGSSCATERRSRSRSSRGSSSPLLRRPTMPREPASASPRPSPIMSRPRLGREP